MRIFVSYARSDKAKVKKIVELLRAAHYEPWFDEELVAGQDWKTELRTRIEQSNTFIYMLTPKSVVSEWCQWEFSIAVQLGKPVIPVLLRETDLPPVLQQLHFADFSKSVSNRAIARLIGDLSQYTQTISKEKAPKAPEHPAGFPSELGSSQEEFEAGRRLEAAMPQQTQLKSDTEVRVKISLPTSDGLRAELPEFIPSGDVIRKEDVQGGKFFVEFERDTQKGNLLPAKVCLEVNSSDYAVFSKEMGMQGCEHNQVFLDIHPNRDSRTIIFKLKPKPRRKVGRSRITISLYQSNKLIAQISVSTEIVEAVEKTPVPLPWQIVSLPLLLALVSYTTQGSESSQVSTNNNTQPSEEYIDKSLADATAKDSSPNAPPEFEPSNIEPPPPVSEDSKPFYKRSEFISALLVALIGAVLAGMFMLGAAFIEILPDIWPDSPSPTPSVHILVISANSVAMREGPGSGYPHIKIFTKDDQLQIRGQFDGWYLVKSGDGDLGWMEANEAFVKVTGEPNDIIEIRPTNTNTATATVTPSITQTNTNTATVTVTPSITPSETPTHTETSTPTPTETYTPTNTYTPTPTPTDTLPPTPTPIPCPSGMLGVSAGRYGLSDFCIDETEVTQAQFNLYQSAIGGPVSGDSDSNLPFILFTPKEAEDYCKWHVDGRLPTEAEWEVAAGWQPEGTQLSTYPWGEDTPNDTLLNFNNPQGVVEVKRYLPNALGMYEMSGNVRELVDTQTEAFLTKGGSFATTNIGELEITNSEIFNRFSGDTGFRCVLSVP